MQGRTTNRIRRTLDALEAREVAATLIQVNTIDGLVSSVHGKAAVEVPRAAATPIAAVTESPTLRAG